ncbi:hypothetical protein [Shouchella patagoniensis]|nr:hypothetical protein [Shouchella patagoniensis]
MCFTKDEQREMERLNHIIAWPQTEKERKQGITQLALIFEHIRIREKKKI